MRAVKNRLIEDMLGSDYCETTVSEACELYMQQHNPKHCFHTFLGFIGCRSYNQFLDYGLLLVRLSKYIDNRDRAISYANSDKKHLDALADLYFRLMFDDRHDLWQNLPCILDTLIPAWRSDSLVCRELCEILVSCINNDGTGNKSERR